MVGCGVSPPGFGSGVFSSVQPVPNPLPMKRSNIPKFAPVLRQIARYLPHHRSENASKTHPKSSHDKFKQLLRIASG